MTDESQPDYFERESLRLILRLGAAWNLGLQEEAGAELQALIRLWCSTPGHGAKREGLTRKEVDAMLAREAAAALKAADEATPLPVRVLSWEGEKQTA